MLRTIRIMLSPSAMTAVLRTFVFLFSLTTALTLPSDLEKQPLAIGDVNSKAQAASSTAPNPREYHIGCLKTRIAPKLNPSDCGYVLNQMILSGPDIYTERRFQHTSYQIDDGKRVPSRWQYETCEVTVFGQRHAYIQLSLYDVALTANRIVQECVTPEINPIGGLSLIGDSSKEFHVILQGHPRAISAKNSTVSQRSSVSVSKRMMGSPHVSETAMGARELVTRDPLAGVSPVSNDLVLTTNLTLPNYPVHCFNPLILHLQPAAAEDCFFIINQIILRLFDPTRQLTWGFTDDVDVNLSKPQYQKWQYAQCMISVKDNDEGQVNTFRPLDLANTARRISTQCLIYQDVKFGGVATIGIEGRGFYVFVGGPLASISAVRDMMLLGESTGVKSS